MKRAPSMHDRDVLVPKHPTPSPGVPAFEIPEEVTGQYEGEQLAYFRRKRRTDERIDRLETKHDKLDDKVDSIDSKVSRMEGKLDTALSHITLVHKNHAATEQVRIGTRGKVIVGVTGAVFAAIGVALAALAKGCA
jgi:hypothetical protein